MKEDSRNSQWMNKMNIFKKSKFLKDSEKVILKYEQFIHKIKYFFQN